LQTVFKRSKAVLPNPFATLRDIRTPAYVALQEIKRDSADAGTSINMSPTSARAKLHQRWSSEVSEAETPQKNALNPDKHTPDRSLFDDHDDDPLLGNFSLYQVRINVISFLVVSITCLVMSNRAPISWFCFPFGTRGTFLAQSKARDVATAEARQTPSQACSA
jgi:hypothetical protein